MLVHGDQARLHQVIANLLANARAHTPAGTVVTTTVEIEDGNAVVEVRDAGPGIDESLVPTVFERFVRADSSRSRAAGSTGLGLAIVAAVVDAHGGRVEVHSFRWNRLSSDIADRRTRLSGAGPLGCLGGRLERVPEHIRTLRRARAWALACLLGAAVAVTVAPLSAIGSQGSVPAEVAAFAEDRRPPGRVG